MPEEELLYWLCNTSWDNKIDVIKPLFKSAEDEAVRLAAKDHLIVFQATLEELMKNGLWY